MLGLQECLVFLVCVGELLLHENQNQRFKKNVALCSEVM